MEINELKKISADNLEFVKDYFLENKVFNPKIIIYTKKGEKYGKIITSLDNDKLVKNRLNVMTGLGINLGVRSIIKKEYDSIEAVFSLNEAWMSRQDKNKEQMLMPSQDPKRMEVLISAGLSSDKKVSVDINIIRRTWNNEKIIISFEKMDTGTDKEDFKVNSPLLESFWDAFNLIKYFWEKAEKTEKLKQYIEKKDTKFLVESFLKIFHFTLEEKSKKTELSSNVKKNA